jgi:two-component system response regulator PilR (NtrC family)
MQVKLLRAIQEKSVRAVGATREQSVDVRLLSATHKDLAALVSAGQFRQDLYYRLNVIGLHIPPLRERHGDIALLAPALLARVAQRHGLPQPPRLTAQAEMALLAYDFPGNVRELENLLERALAVHERGVIDVSDLNLPAPAQTATGASSIKHTVTTNTAYGSLDAHLEAVERQLITKALEETRWNRAEAAKRLGITYRSFRHRLQKLGLD